MNPSATCYSFSQIAFCFLLLSCLQETPSWTSTATRRSAILQPNFPSAPGTQDFEEPTLGQDLGTTSQQATHDSFKGSGLEKVQRSSPSTTAPVKLFHLISCTENSTLHQPSTAVIG
jgi:hypothetical protein